MIYLTKQEYARFYSIVNTCYFAKYAKRKLATIRIDNSILYFQILDFNEYAILSRKETND